MVNVICLGVVSVCFVKKSIFLQYVSCNSYSYTHNCLQVLNILEHLEKGRVEGSVFTDDWPNFQAVLVVFHDGELL